MSLDQSPFNDPQGEPRQRVLLIYPQDQLAALRHAPARGPYLKYGPELAGALVLLGLVGGYFGLPTGGVFLFAVYVLTQRFFPELCMLTGAGGIDGPLPKQIVLREGQALTLQSSGEEMPQPLVSARDRYQTPLGLVLVWQARPPVVLPRRYFAESEFAALLQHVTGTVAERKALAIRALEGVALALALAIPLWTWIIQRDL